MMDSYILGAILDNRDKSVPQRFVSVSRRGTDLLSMLAVARSFCALAR